MDRASLRAECQARIQDQTADIATTTQVALWLNQKIDEISFYTDWPFFRVTTTIPLSAAGNTVNLPADCRKVLKVTVTQGAGDFATPLIPGALSRMQDIDVMYNTRPTHYTMGGLSQALQTAAPVPTLRVYPNADIAYTLTVTYIKQPVFMTSDTHYPPFPREFDEALILGVMVLYWQQVEADDMVRSMQAAYDAKLAQLRFHYGQEFYERFPQIEVMDEGNDLW